MKIWLLSLLALCSSFVWADEAHFMFNPYISTSNNFVFERKNIDGSVFTAACDVKVHSFTFSYTKDGKTYAGKDLNSLVTLAKDSDQHIAELKLGKNEITPITLTEYFSTPGVIYVLTPTTQLGGYTITSSVAGVS